MASYLHQTSGVRSGPSITGTAHGIHLLSGGESCSMGYLAQYWTYGHGLARYFYLGYATT